MQTTRTITALRFKRTFKPGPVIVHDRICFARLQKVCCFKHTFYKSSFLLLALKLKTRGKCSFKECFVKAKKFKLGVILV